MSFQNFLNSIKSCEEDIKVKNLSKNAFTLVISNVVEPFYKKIEVDNEVSNFIGDKDILFRLKIKQTSFTLKFLTKDFNSIMEELDKIIVAHENIKLRVRHFIPYFFIWSNLLFNWLEPKSTPKDMCRWKNKVLKIYAYLSHGHANYDFAIFEDFEKANEVISDSKRENLNLESIDLKKIETMHVDDKDKISAKTFINNLVIDNELLDEMAELERDLSEVLYVDEEISEETIASFTLFIFRYAKLLGNFPEFKELSFALNSLVNVLEKAKFNEDEKRDKKVMTFLNAMIEDLKNWKRVIFDEASANDIHYLDASLFSSCAQLELLLTKKEKENGDSEDIGVELF